MANRPAAELIVVFPVLVHLLHHACIHFPSFYTLFTRFLHAFYTLSTRFLHAFYTLSTPSVYLVFFFYFVFVYLLPFHRISVEPLPFPRTPTLTPVCVRTSLLYRPEAHVVVTPSRAVTAHKRRARNPHTCSNAPPASGCPSASWFRVRISFIPPLLMLLFFFFLLATPQTPRALFNYGAIPSRWMHGRISCGGAETPSRLPLISGVMRSARCSVILVFRGSVQRARARPLRSFWWTPHRALPSFLSILFSFFPFNTHIYKNKNKGRGEHTPPHVRVPRLFFHAL